MSDELNSVAAWTAIRNSFRGHKPSKILASYVIEQVQSGQFQDERDRICAEFLTEIFLEGALAPEQAFIVCRARWIDLVPFCEKIARLRAGPLPVFPTNPRDRWTFEETLNLVECTKNGNGHMLPRLFSHRTLLQCKDRIRYLTRNYETRHAIRNTEVANEEHNAKESTSTAETKYTLLKVKLMRQVYTARKDRLKLQAQCLVLKRKLIQFEKAVTEFEHAADMCDTEEPDSVDPPAEHGLQDQVLSELIFSSHQTERSRRYSDRMRDICQLLQLTSPRTYRLLRQFLPMPSVSCLKYHYSDRFAVTRNMLTDIEMLRYHMNSLFSDKDQDCLCTIGIDAFAFRTFTEKSPFKRTGDSTFSDAFLFMHIPLDPGLAPKVLHIAKKRNGAFDQSILNIFEEIRDLYQARNMKIMFMATDGDRFLSASHREFFSANVEQYRENFFLAVRKVYKRLTKKSLIMPIADPLHFAKNLRGKLIDHNVAVVNSKDLVFTNAARLEKHLRLGPALTDTGQLARMRDKHVTDIFTLKNVCSLLACREFHSAFLLLPYACIFSVLYAVNLSFDARVFLTNLAFTAFEKMFSQAEAIVQDHKTVGFRHLSGLEGITFAEPCFIKRMLHTCIALRISLVFGPRHLRLDAIGTHLLENAIGIARSVSNSTDYERIVSAFANGEMRKEIGDKWKLRLHVSQRINDGGAKIDTLSDEGVSHVEDWDPRDIVSQIQELCLGIIASQHNQEWELWFNDFKAFVAQIRIRNLSEPSSVANALIVERNKQFQS